MSHDGAAPLFVDTAAFYARFQPNDQYHQKTMDVFSAIRQGELVFRPLYTSRFVLAELSRLLLYYSGHEAATRALAAIRDSESFVVLSVDSETFEEACTRFGQYDDQQISLTDHVSAVLADEHDVEHVFSYDTADFQTLEFTLVPATVEVEK